MSSFGTWTCRYWARIYTLRFWSSPLRLTGPTQDLYSLISWEWLWTNLFGALSPFSCLQPMWPTWICNVLGVWEAYGSRWWWRLTMHLTYLFTDSLKAHEVQYVLAMCHPSRWWRPVSWKLQKEWRKSLNKTFTVNLPANRTRWQKAWQCTSLSTTHRNSSKLENTNKFLQCVTPGKWWWPIFAELQREVEEKLKQDLTVNLAQIKRGDRKLDSEITYYAQNLKAREDPASLLALCRPWKAVM